MHASAAITDDRSGPRLALGAVLSLLAHAGFLAVLAVQPPGSAGSALSLVNPPAADLAEPPDPVGIEESNQVSINWLGFADPTEHHATPSETEQAALSPIDPGVAAAVEPAELTEPEELADAEVIPTEVVEAREEVAPEEVAPVEVAVETPAETPAEAPTEVATESPTVTDAVVAELPETPSPLAVLQESSAAASGRFFRVVRQATARAQQLAAQAAQRAVQQAAQEAARQAEALATASPPPGEQADALPSEKESDATSADTVYQWVPGRPAAAEGLEITPVRPQWDDSTRIMALPRNPVVKIDFRKNGTVARAAFLAGHDSGHRDVDGPLLDAIYRWTAKGKALDELPAGDPAAVASIKMQIVLVPQRGTIHRIPSNR